MCYIPVAKTLELLILCSIIKAENELKGVKGTVIYLLEFNLDSSLFFVVLDRKRHVVFNFIDDSAIIENNFDRHRSV